MDFGFAFPMNQAHWWLLAGIAVLTAIVVVLRSLERRRDKRMNAFVESHLAPRLLPGFDGRLRKPLFWLAALGFAFLLLTFAQPHWGQAWQEVHRQSHDVLVLLDTSESMRAENPLPNRLERAKQKIESLLNVGKGDRFGLVVFSGSAELLCPLTLDHGYFKSVLNAVDTDALSLEGTNIEAALKEAIDTYKDLENETGDYNREARAVLLISDGEEVSGDAVALAGEMAKYARVFVIGIGDPRGTEIVYTDSLGRRNRVMEGMKPHISKLDESTLERIAVEGEGAYIRSRPDNGDIDTIFDLVQQMNSRMVDSDIRLQLVNRYQWPLTLAIAFFMGEGLWLVALPRVRAWRMRHGAPSRSEDRNLA